MFDVIIRNGLVVDGGGGPGFKADVGVKDGKVAAVGRLGLDEASRIIDASGLVVSPGFIDMHSHSDFTLLINPKAESKVRQGVTTEVIGNCGASAAPLNEFMKMDLAKTTPLIEEAGLKLDWSTMKEYLDRLDREGVAVNVAPLVGHGNVRAYVINFYDREPSGAELREMKRVLAEAMEDGAFGMSTGLIYPPSCYAKTDELIELSKVVASYGGVYASHIRDEGDGLLDSVKEALEIGVKARLPVEISHHKAGGRANWGKVKESLRIIDEARARGIDVACDVYPYTAASFRLGLMLPPWVHEGGYGRMLERLREPKNRERLRREMEEGLPGWSSPLKAAGWDATQIARCRRNPCFEGRSIAEIAQTKNIDPFEFTFNLLIEEEGAVYVVRFAMCEEDVRTVIKHPASMIGSDSSTAAPYGVLGLGKPHPRAYGSFPRILRRYVREEGVLKLEDSVRKMTSLPARRIGLKDRGLIKEGMYADITIFNLDKVMDKATYTDPHKYPEGIEYVLVNGKIVIERGEHTGILAGRALRKRL